MNIIAELDQEQIARLTAGKEIPEFQPGDTVIVNVKVVEGDRSRVQAYEGVCIARNGGGLNQSFTVRKISYGEGVERVFPLYSPLIDSIKLVRRGKVRRAKLYYLRDRRGKSARIAERTDTAGKIGKAGKRHVIAQAICDRDGGRRGRHIVFSMAGPRPGHVRFRSWAAFRASCPCLSQACAGSLDACRASDGTSFKTKTWMPGQGPSRRRRVKPGRRLRDLKTFRDLGNADRGSG